MVQRLKQKRIVLTVTAGRSGTGLLAALLNQAAGIAAEHESFPLANLELRTTLKDPAAGLNWLVREKFPQIDNQSSPQYVETSHIYCKGFIELFLMVGICPELVILKRPRSEIAKSMLQMNVIPGRSDSGKIVLLQPDDPGVLPLRDWEKFSNYQLCYWYTMEIERRQAFYRGLLFSIGVKSFDVTMGELTDWDAFKVLCQFVQPGNTVSGNRHAYQKVVSTNQNAISKHTSSPRLVPANCNQQESEIDWACAPYLANMNLAAK